MVQPQRFFTGGLRHLDGAVGWPLLQLDLFDFKGSEHFACRGRLYYVVQHTLVGRDAN